MTLHRPEPPLLGFLERFPNEPFLEEDAGDQPSKTIINGPPMNSPSTNCQPSKSHMMIPSSITRFVDAISKSHRGSEVRPLPEE